MTVFLDAQTLQLIGFFEQMTGAQVKDCVSGEGQIFLIVEQGEAAKAIGKGGKHVRDLENRIKKKVRIAEFDSDIIQFIQNLIAPIELSEAKLEDDSLILRTKDLKSRGLLIGRNASTLRFYESIVQRYFPIKEIKVT